MVIFLFLPKSLNNLAALRFMMLDDYRLMFLGVLEILYVPHLSEQ